MSNSAPTFPGLLHAVQLDGSGGVLAIPSTIWTGSNSDAMPVADNIWLHMDFEVPEVRHWLEERSGLNQVAVDGLLSLETRPRTLNRGDNLLLTLRGINQNPGEDPEDMVSLRIWTDGKRLLSTRKRRLASTQDVIDELRAGSGAHTIAGVLVELTERITDRMTDAIESLEDQLLAQEEQVLAGQHEGVRLALVKLRQQTISIRRYLAPQREAMNRLCNENLTWLDDMHRLRLRDITDRLIRHIEALDEVRDRAALAQEEIANQIAESMNERSYFFTVVAVVFLPLGFLTGLLGINVGGMPGTDSSSAFWIVVAACAVLGVMLWLLLKLRKWL